MQATRSVRRSTETSVAATAFLLLVAACVATANAGPAGPPARVTEGANNNPAQFIGRSAVNYPMIQIAIENRSMTEPLELRGATLSASGTGNETGAILAGGVALYHDANNNGDADMGMTPETMLGAATQFAANDGTVSFAFAGSPLEIAPGATANIVCVYNMNGTGTVGQTFRLSLDQAAHIDLVGKTSGLAATVTGPPVLGLAKAIGQGKLLLNALPDLNNTIPAFLPSHPHNSGIRLQIDNTYDERVSLKSINVKVTGPADETRIIAPNGVRFQIANLSTQQPSDMFPFLAEASMPANNGTAQLVFNPPLEIPRGAVRYCYVTVQTLATADATSLYFSEMTFSIPQGAVVADGLDSGATGIEVLGQGLAGPVRQYRGSEIDASTSSNDLGDVFASPGSVDYPVLAFTMRTAINFETITVSELEFRSTGTLNEATQLSNATLWLDNGSRRGRVDRTMGGDVTMLDTLLQGNVSFSMDDGTIVFDNLNLNVGTSTANYLLAFDVSGSAADGATFQVSMPSARSVDGIGATTLAPPVISNLDLTGGVREILRNEFTLTDNVGGTREAQDRKELPRRGGSDPAKRIIAWNFDVNVSPNEPLLLEEVRVQVTGTLNDPLSLVSATIGNDNNLDGDFADSNEYALPALTNLAALGNNPLLVFPFDPGAPIEFDADDSTQMELYLELDGGTETYGSTIQFEIVGMSLRGAFSGALATRATTPFQSVAKTIRQPYATITTSSAVDPTLTFDTCVNNFVAEYSVFRMASGLSESVELQAIVIGASPVGLPLNDFVGGGGAWRGGADLDFGPGDIFMGSASGPFDGSNQLTIPINPSDPDDAIAEFFATTPPHIGTFLSFDSPVAVPVDRSVRAAGSIVALMGVGVDSGDEVLFSALPLSVGEFSMVAGGLDPLIADLGEDIVAPGSVENVAWRMTPNVSIIEDLTLETFTLQIAKSPGLGDLAQVVDQGTFYLGWNNPDDSLFISNSGGVVNFANETVTFTMASPFYRPQATPNLLTVYADILPTAPENEWIELRLNSYDDMRFSGNCSLVGPELVDHSYGFEVPAVGARLLFQTEGLRFELQQPNDDLPWTALPDNASGYEAGRFKVRTIGDLEEVRLQGLTLHVSGTANDVSALAAGNGVALFAGNAMLAEGVFDADDGSVAFSGFDIVVGTGFSNLSVRMTTSAATQSGANDGQTLLLRFDEMDVAAQGADSGIPITKFVANYDGVAGDDEYPFLFPEIRIGAGRVFVERRGNELETFVVSDSVNVVTLAFNLEADRAEDARLEEVRLNIAGSIDDPNDVEGAVVLVYEDKNPLGEVNLEGAGADVLLGAAPIVFDDGDATARFTPGFLLPSETVRNFILAVDLNGMASDFEDFQHTLSGNLAIVAVGDLSHDPLTPHYGSDRAIDPDAGLIAGPNVVVGRATLDLDVTTDLPQPDAANPRYILPDQDDVAMLSFNYEALEIEDMQAVSFTFGSGGSGSEPAAVEPDGVKLYRDLDSDGVVDATDVLIGSATFSADDETLTIPFSQPLNIVEGDEDQWLLAYDFGPNTGLRTTFNAGLILAPETLEPIEGIVSGEGLFSMREIGVIRSSAANRVFAGPVIETSTGIVELTKGSNSTGNRDVLRDAPDVPLVQVRLRERFSLEDVRPQTLSLNILPSAEVSVGNLFAPGSLRLYRESTVNGVVDPEDGSPVATGVVNVSSSRITFSFNGVDEIDAGATNTYLVVGSMAAPISAAGGTFRLEAASETQFAGLGLTTMLPATPRLPNTFTSGIFTFAGSTATVTRLSSTPDDTDAFTPDGQNQLMLGIGIRPTSASDANLLSMRVDASGSINEATAFSPNGARLVRDNGTTSNVLDASDTTVATGNFSGDNGFVLFTMAPGAVVLTRNVTNNFFVVGDFSGAAMEEQTVAVRLSGASSVSLSTFPLGGPCETLGSFPHAGGPTPVQARRATFSAPPGAPAGFDIIATTQAAVLWDAYVDATQAENLRISGLTFDFLGSGNDLAAIQAGAVALVRDANDNGLVDPGESALASANITGDNGSAAFSNLMVAVNAGARDRFLLAASFAGTALVGETFQATLSSATVVGATSTLPAQAAGLPLAGPVATVASATYDFRAVGAESRDHFAYNSEADATLLTLRVVPSTADDVTLQSLAFTLTQASDASFLTPGTLRLVLDGNRTGRYESTDAMDVVLASGATFDGAGRVVFGGLTRVLPKSKDNFLLLVGNPNGTAPDQEDLAVMVSPGDSTAVATSSGQAAAPNGLPYSGARRVFVSTAARVAPPLLDEFEGAVSNFRPSLTWLLANDPSRSLAGTGYASASDLLALPEGGDFSLELIPPTDPAAQARSMQVAYHVRYDFPDTDYRGRLQFSTNGGSTWSNIRQFTGASAGWEFFSNDFNATQNGASDLRVRFLLDGGNGTSGNAYFHVDRFIYQARPNIELRTFNPDAGFTKSITPGQQGWRARFDVRNTRGQAITIQQIGFHVHALDGRRFTDLVAVSPVSGSNNVNNSQTVTRVFSLDFDGAIPTDVGQLKLVPYLVATDDSTGETVYSTYALADFLIDVITPTQGFSLR